MRITDLLSKQSISLGVKLGSKSEAIDKLILLHQQAGNLADVSKYKKVFLQEKNSLQQLLVRA